MHCLNFFRVETVSIFNGTVFFYILAEQKQLFPAFSLCYLKIFTAQDSENRKIISIFSEVNSSKIIGEQFDIYQPDAKLNHINLWKNKFAIFLFGNRLSISSIFTKIVSQNEIKTK